MSELINAQKPVRLIKLCIECNISTDTATSLLTKQNLGLDEGQLQSKDPKLHDAQIKALYQEFQNDKRDKNRANQVEIAHQHENKRPKHDEKEISYGNKKPQSSVVTSKPTVIETPPEDIVSLEPKPTQTKSQEIPLETQEKNLKNTLKTEAPKIEGPKILGIVDLERLNTKKSPQKSKLNAKESTQASEKPTPEHKEPIPSISVEQPSLSIEPPVEPIHEAPLPKQDIEKTSNNITVDNTINNTNKDSGLKPTTPELQFGNIKADKLKGLTVVNKIDLTNIPSDTKPIYNNNNNQSQQQNDNKRKRIKVKNEREHRNNQNNTLHKPNGSQPPTNDNNNRTRVNQQPFNKPFVKNDRGGGGPKKYAPSSNHQGQPNREIDEKLIQEKIKETQAKLAISNVRVKGAKGKLRKLKREEKLENETKIDGENILQVTEFLTVSELASLMNVAFTDVIAKCMHLGIMATINQRLDAEVIELVASEFNFEVQFVSIEETEEFKQQELEDDNIEDNEVRPPIVTIMGHVDHGKTSLLDYIRNANVVAGEAGGITQHIGAYEVTLENSRKITFLDTPGHEAFTSMRARGAKITDIAVIVIAADDAVMPQTREAINHAMAANVDIIIAVNKIDKDGVNPEKIYEQLSQMNLLVESWGGKYQNQEISAKKGLNVDVLLEKILLQADLLNVKANSEKFASGTVIEASLDKGRGNMATILVQNGTLHVGDCILSGQYFGKIKALFNERNQKIKTAGPSTPVVILGLNGAPQAGEKFKVYLNESDAKEKANKRSQLIREQGLRTKKHITLDEIGRRLALGKFKELNIIIKGDVDGSVEALSDSLQKLSTPEIAVKVIHKGVGQISESDVLLAAASDAIIIGFNVRASLQANKLIDVEGVEVKLYSIIYNAIEEIKSAMEGMLEPHIKEKITANVQIKEVFKFDKVSVAGCFVLNGKILKTNKIRVIRDGIVIYPKNEQQQGELTSLKRFKDDVKEVLSGMECGISIKNFNDFKVDDIIEAFEEEEIKRTL